MSNQPPLLVIGWDAADWNIMRPLLQAGRMPALAKLMKTGVWGNLTSVTPMLSPLLWTTIATGHYADKHDILGFVEPNQDGTALRPVSSKSRKCKAIWNMLTQHGLSSNIVNWFASHPAEPIKGNFVSNAFHPAGQLSSPFTNHQKSSLHPQSLNDRIANLRVSTRELLPSDIEPFLPRARELVAQGDPLIASFAKNLAQAASMQAVSTFLFREDPALLNAVYFQTIDLVGHEFMQFHPPQRPHVDQQQFQDYKDVIYGTYCFHDMMLQSMLEQMPEDTRVIILSDHGFHHDTKRPKQNENWRVNAMDWHRKQGMIVMAGPGIRSDERIWGASLMDIAPTILYLLDLPIGKDMPGRPLRQAFTKTTDPTYIPSWDDEAGDAGMHVTSSEAEEEPDPWQVEEMLKQLAALGYITFDAKQAGQLKRARKDRLGNLIKVYLSTDRPQEALPLIDEMLEVESPEDSAQAKLYYYVKAKALAAIGELDAAEAFMDENSHEIPKRMQMQLIADMLLRRGMPEKAVDVYKKITEAEPDESDAWSTLGHAYLQAGDIQNATQAFDAALEIQSDNTKALHGKGIALLEQKKNQEASEALLDTISFDHFQPRAHMHLGIAWMRLAYPLGAMYALETALSLDPDLRPALKMLTKVHETLVETGQVTEEVQASVKRHAGRD